MKKIILHLTSMLFFILVSFNILASQGVNEKINIDVEKLVTLEVKMLSLNDRAHDLSNRLKELNKALNENRALQNKINVTASNRMTFIEEKYSTNKQIPIEINQPVNWYPYLIPLVTIFLVFASMYTIKVKSEESLKALKNSNTTLVGINNKSILEEHSRSQKVIITNYRQEWINSLRDEITSFLAVIASISPTENLSKMPKEMAKNLFFHSYKIELLLNPKERDHQELVDKIRREVNILIRQEEATLISEIISLSQEILKKEWNRVKQFEKS